MPDPITLTVTTITNVAKGIFNLRSKLSEAKLDRKDRVADYLSIMAQIIEDVSASLKHNIYPHGKCTELLCHAENMPEAIGDLVGREKAEEYARQLIEVHTVEKLHSALSNCSMDKRESSLTTLDEAAGLFRAVSAFVRVSSQ